MSKRKLNPQAEHHQVQEPKAELQEPKVHIVSSYTATRLDGVLVNKGAHEVLTELICQGGIFKGQATPNGTFYTVQMPADRRPRKARVDIVCQFVGVSVNGQTEPYRGMETHQVLTMLCREGGNIVGQSGSNQVFWTVITYFDE